MSNPVMPNRLTKKFADCILVKLSPSSPHLIALTTYDVFHGASSRFLLLKSDLETLAEDENASSIVDTDIGNYVEISRNGAHLQFRLTLLNRNFRNEVTGYVHDFHLSISNIQATLEGQAVCHVEHTREERSKAQLMIKENSHQMIRKVCQDKLIKHALRKFFRDHFNYGTDELLVIHPDSWIKGFYFHSAYNKFNGGIVLHEDKVKGKNGRMYRKVYYSIHT